MTSRHLLVANWLIAAVMLSACFQSSHAAKQRRESSEYSLWSCAHDMVTYCNDVVPGDLRMKDCLVYHRKLLLPVCREKKTTYREIVPQSCESDAVKHCDQENIHDKTRCLRVKFARLSQACLDALPLNPPFESLPIELKHMSVDSECSITLFKECRQTVGGKDLADCVQHHALPSLYFCNTLTRYSTVFMRCPRLVVWSHLPPKHTFLKLAAAMRTSFAPTVLMHLDCASGLKFPTSVCRVPCICALKTLTYSPPVLTIWSITAFTPWCRERKL
jgi:hypothetical protein